MKIATWNINSVRPRVEHVCKWLKENQVDVLLLQEIKCTDEQFPREAFEDLGYNVETFGQKTFHGVAILAKGSIEDVQKGIPHFEDNQARYLEAFVCGKIRVASIYVPNGQEPGCDKYSYKLNFLKALQSHLISIRSLDEPFLMGGDYNIAPCDIDVYDPSLWQDRILCTLPERKALKSLLNIGFYDAFRLKHPENKQFSWWDYRAQSFEKDHGLRIDYFLVSPSIIDICKDVIIDPVPRKWDKPSDHTPVIIEIE